MTPPAFCGTIPSMKVAAFVAALSLFAPAAASAQTSKVGEAYAQYLLGHRLEEADDDAGAIAAYKRAMELDPQAADIPATLAALYLRQNKAQDAIATAEQALKLAPVNRSESRARHRLRGARRRRTRRPWRARRRRGGAARRQRDE